MNPVTEHVPLLFPVHTADTLEQIPQFSMEHGDNKTIYHTREAIQGFPVLSQIGNQLLGIVNQGSTVFIIAEEGIDLGDEVIDDIPHSFIQSPIVLGC